MCIRDSGYSGLPASNDTLAQDIGRQVSMFEQAFKNIDDVLWKEAGCTTELDYTEQSEKHELSHLYEAKIRSMGNAGRNGGVGSAGFLCEAFDTLKAQPNLTTSDLKTLQERTFYGKEKKSLAFVIAIMNMILHGIDAPNIVHSLSLIHI